MRLPGLNVRMVHNGSAEREREGLHARIEKLDLEQSIGDGPGLPDQLIQPLLGNRAVALLVDVDAVSSTWRLSIDQHAKPHGGALALPVP